MRTIQLMLDSEDFRFRKSYLSSTPQIFKEGSPQKKWLEAESIKLPKKLDVGYHSDSCILEKRMKGKYLSFSVDIDGRAEEVYDQMNAFFEEKESKYRWRGWGHRDTLFCYLLDFCQLPSQNPRTVARNKNWWKVIEDLKCSFRALQKSGHQKTSVGLLFEGYTIKFTPEEVKARIQVGIGELVNSFDETASGSVSRKVQRLVNEEDFERAFKVLKSLKPAKSIDDYYTGIYASQIYSWFEDDQLIKKQLKKDGRIIQHGTETHIFQLISAFLEYTGLLPELDSKPTDSHHYRGRRKIDSYRRIQKTYSTDEGVVIGVLKI